MIDIKTGKEIENPAILKAPLAGSANASGEGAARGMMRNKGAQLSCVFGEDKPYDAEIEYLRSNGMQLIETDIDKYNGCTVQVDAQIISGNGFVTLFGFGAESGNWFGSFNNNWYPCSTGIEFGSSANRRSFNIYYGQRTTIVTSGTDNYSIPQSESDTPFSIFKTKYNGTYQFGGNCYLFSISMDGVFDMIPVRVGTFGYLYDRVSKRLFGNSGTGSFILGHDKMI